MYDLKTDWVNFAKEYLSGTISSFVHQLPIVFPAKHLATRILVAFLSSLVFGLLFKFIFGSRW